MPPDTSISKYYVGENSPRISKTLSSVLGSFDVVVGQTFTLLVRPRDTGEIVLNVVMTADVDANAVYYDPQDGDFNAEGYYRAWIHVDLGGGTTQDTDEWDLVVFSHSPGVGVRIGAVARMARRRVPIAWDALRNYVEYGDPGLQEIVELVKLRSLPDGMIVTAADEESLDVRVTNYVALLAAIEVLKVAMEYWTGQYVTQTAVGSAEVRSYPDRIAAAEKLLPILMHDADVARAEAEIVLGQIGGLVTSGATMVDGGPLVTAGVNGLSAHLLGYGGAHPWWCE
jgi:hypothetical protein